MLLYTFTWLDYIKWKMSCCKLLALTVTGSLTKYFIHELGRSFHSRMIKLISYNNFLPPWFLMYHLDTQPGFFLWLPIHSVPVSVLHMYEQFGSGKLKRTWVSSQEEENYRDLVHRAAETRLNQNVMKIREAKCSLSDLCMQLHNVGAEDMNCGKLPSV